MIDNTVIHMRSKQSKQSNSKIVEIPPPIFGGGVFLKRLESVAEKPQSWIMTNEETQEDKTNLCLMYTYSCSLNSTLLLGQASSSSFSRCLGANYPRVDKRSCRSSNSDPPIE
jgi:hypothetical protein